MNILTTNYDAMKWNHYSQKWSHDINIFKSIKIYILYSIALYLKISLYYNIHFIIINFTKI